MSNLASVESKQRRSAELAILRDQIAIRAMEITISADPRYFMEQVCAPDPAPLLSLQNVSRIAYGLADAMIEARNRK